MCGMPGIRPRTHLPLALSSSPDLPLAFGELFVLARARLRSASCSYSRLRYSLGRRVHAAPLPLGVVAFLLFIPRRPLSRPPSVLRIILFHIAFAFDSR